MEVRSMRVEEIMNKDVKTTEPKVTVQEAAEEMSRYGIGCLLVVKNKKLIGIITERDIMKKVVAEDKQPSKTLVENIMTKDVILISPDMEIEEAAELMMKHNIKKLPVIIGHQLIGIVTATDICAAEPKMLENLSKLMLIPKKRLIAG